MAVDSVGEDHGAGKDSRRAFDTLRQARLEATVLSTWLTCQDRMCGSTCPNRPLPRRGMRRATTDPST